VSAPSGFCDDPIAYLPEDLLNTEARDHHGLQERLRIDAVLPGVVRRYSPRRRRIGNQHPAMCWGRCQHHMLGAPTSRE